MARLLRDRYFWYIVALLASAAFFTYLVEDWVLSNVPSEAEKHSSHMVFMTARSLQLLLVVVITAWRFGSKAAMSVVFLIGLILAPHIIGEMAEPLWINDLVTYGIWAIVAVLLVWMVGSRKQTLDALRKEKETVQKYLDVMGAMLIAITADGEISLINRKGCEVLGYQEEEVIGKNWFDNFLPERTGDEVKAVFGKLMAGEIEPLEYFENPVLTKSGEERIIAWHNTVLTGETGDIVGTLSSGEDVTERRLAELALRRSTEFSTTILNSMDDAISVIDVHDFTIVRVNDAFLQWYGVKEDEVVGKTCYELTHHRSAPCTPSGDPCPLVGTVATGEYVVAEHTHYVKDNEKIYVEVATSPVKDENGKVIQVVHVAHNITERKRTEEDIKQKNRHLSMLLEVSQVLNASEDADTVNQRIIENAIKLLGLDTGAIYKINGVELMLSATTPPLPPHFPDELRRATLTDHPHMQKAVSARIPIVLEDTATAVLFPAERTIVEMRSLRSVLYLPLIDGKKVLGIMILGTQKETRPFSKDEINLYRAFSAQAAINFKNAILYQNAQAERLERKRAEEELKKSKADLEEAQRISGTGSWEWDSVADVVTWSKGLFNILGRDLGKPAPTYAEMPSVYTPESFKRLDKVVRKALKDGAPYEIDLEMICEDGQVRTVLTLGEAIYGADGKTIGLRGTVQDVTEKRLAERVLNESHKDLEVAQRLTKIGNWKWILATNKVAWSEELCRINKWDMGRPIPPFAEMSSFYTPDSWKRLNKVVAKALNGGKAFEIELDQLQTDGTIIITVSRGEADYDSSGKVTGLHGTVQDVTERKRMQERLMITDRLASVGELASGVAHELNNPLTGVIGFSELLLARDVPKDIQEDIEIIHREAQRAAAVVRNLLIFAGKHPPSRQLVDINSIITSTLGLRTYDQKINNIKVITHFARDLPEMLVDHFQLQQAFLNIIINAEHFMLEAHNKGILTITTERADNVIRIFFADDGPGISEEAMGHLFDPFYTTKEVGKGTGLGLSICHGIIREHNGRIYAESEPGKGATFIVELPITTIDDKRV